MHKAAECLFIVEIHLFAQIWLIQSEFYMCR